MNFNDLDFLIYSSHKTATQTLLSIINNNEHKSIHCHTIDNLYLTLHTYEGEISNETFKQTIINYKNINNKKIKIISIVRNPKDRLISSFFQSFSTDEINFLNKPLNNTTIDIKNVDELCLMYENLINDKTLPGFNESIDEMSDIFKINIIEKLEKKINYYYFNHELFELYVLDFNRIINSESLNYINQILETNFIILKNENLSIDKNYYNKYITVKKMLGTKLDNIIEQHFNSFYFTSFLNNIFGVHRPTHLVDKETFSEYCPEINIL